MAGVDRCARTKNRKDGRAWPLRVVFCWACITLIMMSFVFQTDVPQDSRAMMEDGLTFDGRHVPHVDDCQTCSMCFVDEDLGGGPSKCEAPSAAGSAHDLKMNKTPQDRKLHHCLQCRGCKSFLQNVDSREKLLNSEFVHENGGSRAWIFETQVACSDVTRVKTPVNTAQQSTAFGQEMVERIDQKNSAIVKLWCLPFDHHMGSDMEGLAIFQSVKKIGGINHRNKIILTEPSRPFDFYCDQDLFNDDVRNAIAFRRIAEECGLDEIVPKVWIDRVKSTMPGTGYPIDMDGLWQSKAAGVSLSNIAHPSTDINDVISLMTSVNSTQVVLAAIFDLLTSQCDRNSNNVYLTEDGQITLIDNSEGLGKGSICSSGRELSSIFLPSTTEYTFRLAGKLYSKTGLTKLQQDMPTPHVLMDYRCHTSNGLIGRNFPPMVSQCLKRFSGMKTSDLKEYLGLLHSEMALYLQGRSINLLQKGFEWTLAEGKPKSSSIFQFNLQPPCCKMQIKKGWFTRRLECEGGWTVASVHKDHDQ